MCATYAIHAKPVTKNKAGDKQAGWHVHYVICPRKPDGKMLRLRKQELKALKAAYHDLAVRHNLKTGWELEPEKPAAALATLASLPQCPDR